MRDCDEVNWSAVIKCGPFQFVYKRRAFKCKASLFYRDAKLIC